MGTESNKAVKPDNCCGEKFLPVSIHTKVQNEVAVTGQTYSPPLLQ